MEKVGLRQMETPADGVRDRVGGCGEMAADLWRRRPGETVRQWGDRMAEMTFEIVKTAAQEEKVEREEAKAHLIAQVEKARQEVGGKAQVQTHGESVAYGAGLGAGDADGHIRRELRDRFAIAALTGMLAAGGRWDGMGVKQGYAHTAYAFASEMMLEREKVQE